jgi:hypothetical protein
MKKRRKGSIALWENIYLLSYLSVSLSQQQRKKEAVKQKVLERKKMLLTTVSLINDHRKKTKKDNCANDEINYKKRSRK